MKVWYDWASLPENKFYYLANTSSFKVLPGDIILFDRLLENVELDHIGIVVEVKPKGVVVAEGNVRNRTGIFYRPLGKHMHGFIRLSKF